LPRAEKTLGKEILCREPASWLSSKNSLPSVFSLPRVFYFALGKEASLPRVFSLPGVFYFTDLFFTLGEEPGSRQNLRFQYWTQSVIYLSDKKIHDPNALASTISLPSIHWCAMCMHMHASPPMAELAEDDDREPVTVLMEKPCSSALLLHPISICQFVDRSCPSTLRHQAVTDPYPLIHPSTTPFIAPPRHGHRPRSSPTTWPVQCTGSHHLMLLSFLSSLPLHCHSATPATAI
jgi:hypothetical protein